MCNKVISINVEPVRPLNCSNFLISAHCVFEFDTPGLSGPLSCFWFQPALHSWFNKGHHMYYPVSGIKQCLAANQ